MLRRQREGEFLVIHGRKIGHQREEIKGRKKGEALISQCFLSELIRAFPVNEHECSIAEVPRALEVRQKPSLRLKRFPFSVACNCAAVLSLPGSCSYLGFQHAPLEDLMTSIPAPELVLQPHMARPRCAAVTAMARPVHIPHGNGYLLSDRALLTELSI